MAPPPTLKLTYFDLAARAEGSRVMLRLGGVPFEDERVSRADFTATLKATLPYGQVPVLTIDGELLAETQAIQRYAARVAGMYPLDDPLAALMVEELITTVSDLYETKVIASMREQDPEKKLKLRQAMATELLPTALRQIEARLEQLAEYAYFKRADGKMFAHEIVLSMFIATLQSGRVDHVPTTIADGYARAMATHKRVQDAIKAGQAISTPPAFPVTPTKQKPQKLKLTYFDIPARGEFIRLALHIGGVAFEDERITYADMPARKPALPFGQLPALEVNGVVMAQSFALLRYASMLSGLYPVHDPLAAARMDEIIARVEEVYHAFQASFDTKDPEQRRAIRERLLAANTIQPIFSTLEKRIQQWQKAGPFVFGETLSIADLAVYHIVDFLKSGDFDYVPVTIADEFTTLVGIHAAVLNHPRVKDWYATRPAK